MALPGSIPTIRIAVTEAVFAMAGDWIAPAVPTIQIPA